MRNLWYLVAMGLMLGTNDARGAEQGMPGSTSAGSIGIRISIAPRIAITGVRDLPMGRGALDSGRSPLMLCLSSSLRSYTLSAAGADGSPPHQFFGGERAVLDAMEGEAPRTTLAYERYRSPLKAETADAPDRCGKGSVPSLIVIGGNSIDEGFTERDLGEVLVLTVTPG